MPAPNVDLSNKTILITGFTAGVGKAGALALARMGASLHLLCRNREKGERVQREIHTKCPEARTSLLIADLASLDEVRHAAATFCEAGIPLDVLWNNAGVIMQQRETTVDGYETTFAVNHLSLFLLTHLLRERLREADSARVVSTASDAHKFGGPLRLDDLQSERGYTTFGAYGRSKLANILFTRELGRREREAGSKVCALAYHPGFVGSDFAKNNGWLSVLMMNLGRPFARSGERGAETGVYLCSQPGLEGQSGGYYYDMKPRSMSSAARDDEAARGLWEASEKLCGLTD